MKTSILVTGGAGFIGSHTCVALLDAGHEVVVLDNLCNSDASVVRRIGEICGRDPVFIEGNTFNEGQSKIKISNSSDFKLMADYNFQSSAKLIVEPGSYSGTIDPNDVKTMDINLQGFNITNCIGSIL